MTRYIQGFPRVASVFAILVAFVLADSEPRFVLAIAPSQNAIHPGTAEFRKGAPVFFIVTMKNNSQQVLHFALINPAFNYRTTVLDAQGKHVPETENLRKLREQLKSGLGVTTRNVLITLNKGEICHDTIEVSYLYDLSKPGEYTVQVERDLPQELGSGVVRSNLVKITISEK